MSKGGGFLPPEAYCQDIRSGDVVFSGVPNIGRLHAEYQSGATFHCPDSTRMGAAQRLTTAVEAYLDHAIHTNVLPHAGAVSGFGPHYDVHDVFVFQISGSKHWKIYSPIFDLPPRQPAVPPANVHAVGSAAGARHRAGDLLYLPRASFTRQTPPTALGACHAWRTVYTWMELLAIWLHPARTTSLSPRVASRLRLPSELKQGLKAEFSKLVSGLHDKLDGEN